MTPRSTYCCLILIAILILACHSSHRTLKKNPPAEVTNHFSNIIRVEQLGDTFRLEVEKRGENTLIKHYIDVRGRKNNNFDNSYNVECNYKLTNIDTILKVNSKEVKIKAFLTENYKTGFSAGQNEYVITTKGDTVLYQHKLEYIK